MKKKAFTLTELLVVVVIIGVLAAVVLPKFTQVLETRRTTEAEEIMRAVRSEQEARCTLDKNYTAERAELSSFPANEGNNYNYTFTATGIAAASRNKAYTLRIPSYRDGEICCEGDDCARLGKTYPACTAHAGVDECAAAVACNLHRYSEACPEGQAGQIIFEPNADCTGYERVNQCYVSGEPVCVPTNGGQTTYTEPCGEGYDGEKRYTWNATTCVYDEIDNCVENGHAQPCAPTHGGQTTYTEPCDEGYDGVKTYTWDISICDYKKAENCTKKTCEPTNGGQATYTEPCPEKDGFKLQAGSVYYTWDDQACNYAKDDQCNYKDCSNPPQGKVYYLSDCPSPQVGSGTVFTWDEAACGYKKTGYYCSDGNGNESKISCVKIVEKTGITISNNGDCGSGGTMPFYSLVSGYSSPEYHQMHPLETGLCAQLAAHIGGKAHGRFISVGNTCDWICMTIGSTRVTFQQKVAVEQISEMCLPSELDVP